MNPLWKQVVINTVLNKKKVRNASEQEFSQFVIAKGFRALMITIKRLLKDTVLITAGILAAAFGLEGFLLPNSFIDGGATGISLLLTELTKMPLYMFLLVVNIPFVLLGFNVVGKQFAIKTALAITGLSLSVAFIHFPEITHDKLLVAVFGGFFLGAGIGLSVRGGAVIDGTEVLAIYLSRKFSSTIGDIIILINIIIFSFAAYLLSIETALYSMVTYLAASKTLDFVIEGIEEYTGVTIISPHYDEIVQMITSDLGRGVTVYTGHKGYGKRGQAPLVEIIYTVITRLELSRLKTELEKIDPYAFVVMNNVKDIKGGLVKKRPLNH